MDKLNSRLHTADGEFVNWRIRERKYSDLSIKKEKDKKYTRECRRQMKCGEIYKKYICNG